MKSRTKPWSGWVVASARCARCVDDAEAIGRRHRALGCVRLAPGTWSRFEFCREPDPDCAGARYRRQRTVCRSAGPASQRFTVHRDGDGGEDQSIPSTGYRWRLFAGGMPNDDLEVFHLLFPRKNRMDLMVSHPGQEYCYVLSGRIRFHVGAEIFELAAGEGIFLNSELPHRADNIGEDEARILMVVAKSSHAKSSERNEHFDWWRVADAAAPARSAKKNQPGRMTMQPAPRRSRQRDICRMRRSTSTTLSGRPFAGRAKPARCCFTRGPTADRTERRILRLEPGAHHPIHHHDFAQVWYILSGEFRIDDNLYPAGTMISIPIRILKASSKPRRAAIS